MDAAEPMSAVDAAWLRMDRPTNPMMICGVMRLAAPLDLAALRHAVEQRMLCFHRFRQRVMQGDGAPRWEAAAHLDPRWHVRRLARHGPLEQVLSELAATPLDRGRPMWQFHLLADGRASAVVLRIHHCYADGFALLHVVDALTDADPRHPRAAPGDVAAPEPPRAAWERMLGPVSETVGDALRYSRALAAGGTALLAHPLRGIDYARSGADLLAQAAAIASMAPDTPTRLKGPLGTMKRAAWAEPLALDQVKAVAALLGCTVNDVLVACFAGALRGWLLDQGEPPEIGCIRALVPVNLRPPGPVVELGNHFGLVFLDLPVDVAEPVARTLEAHRRMEALKQSQQPLVALALLAGMGLAPEATKERLLDALSANASLVLTNVHGPDQPRYLAGRRIASQMFWVPQAGSIGLGASILSYAGQVRFGVIADTLRVPDPRPLAHGFAREFEALLLAALMLPWPAAGARHTARRRSGAGGNPM